MAKLIAHRGFAKHGFYENTIPAFEDAARSQAWGIETDVHPTKDGIFVTHHDPSVHNTIFNREHNRQVITRTDFHKLRKTKIGPGRGFEIPSLEEYLAICKSGSKQAVVELKGLYTNENIEKLITEIDDASYLDNTTLISFNHANLLRLRQLLPQQPIQLLTKKVNSTLLDFMSENNFDLDMKHTHLSKELIDEAHARGMEVNCWTLDDPLRATHLQSQGVDAITSDTIDRL